MVECPPRQEIVVIAAWDAVVRLVLVAAASLELRREVRLARLACITEPMRFVRAVIVPAGRHVALVIALLPRWRRVEAAITFLAGRTLAAIDRRAAGPAAARGDVMAGVAYLIGESEELPRGRGRTTGPADGLDALLAARLPLLRAALEALPGDAVRRCRGIIEGVGDGIRRARSDRRSYADHVLGEAAVYAARIAAPTLRPPVAACRAAGRAIPLAAELRKAVTPRARDVLLDRALPSLAFVPRLLRWLPASIGPGTRAAVTLLVLTTYPFSRHELSGTAPPRLRHPLRAALAAGWSRRAYLATVAAIEATLRDADARLADRFNTPVAQPVVSAVPLAGVMRSELATISFSPAQPQRRGPAPPP